MNYQALCTFLFLLYPLVFSVPTAKAEESQGFHENFNLETDRHFISPQVWSNPMEAWKLKNKRVETICGHKNLNLQLLTHSIVKGKGGFTTSADFGVIKGNKFVSDTGFRFGIKTELGDYRSALLIGKGVDAGINQEGKLFIGKTISATIIQEKSLHLEMQVDAQNNITLKAFSEKKQLVGSLSSSIKAEQLLGNLALVGNYKGKNQLHWFDNWKLSGPQTRYSPERSFGPILWTQYTLSRQVMKMNVQMPPMGKNDTQTITLEIKKNDTWQTIGKSQIHPQSRTAQLRVENWDDTQDHPYRVKYNDRTSAELKPYYWEGTVRRDPVDRPLKVAGFTGNMDPLFPNTRLVGNVSTHNPDLLFFSGDQLYEWGNGGYGILRSDDDLAHVNYLRRWYLFGWAFRDVLKDRPSIMLPDDHDVYQGNIWGNGGNRVTMKDHPKGGYNMHEDFVNTVHRTQTGHHPDAYDPTPIKRGISVYYGDMVYGRTSFAILADRMFKSGPMMVSTWKGRPDYTARTDIDIKKLDHPDAVLLGERQLKFLDHWASNWKGADMKCVLSQTIFANLANYIGPKRMHITIDLDSNGWPQTGRNKALESIRRGHAFMLAGDQHLASIVHHGIDQQGDAGFSFCVPSICVAYPRAWRPDKEGRPVVGRIDDIPNTGDYTDGFANKVRVYAVANPNSHPPRDSVDGQKAAKIETWGDGQTDGYGIVSFDTKSRQITMNCYRLLFDASKPKAGDQFPGWPRTISNEQNDGRAAVAYLPEINVKGTENPVFDVLDSKGEMLYSIRPGRTQFKAKVFNAKGPYSIIVSDPDKGVKKTIKNLAPGQNKTIDIDL